MKILIASDHGGFKLKELIKIFLKQLNHSVTDLGTDSEESVDYPDFAKKLVKEILKSKNAKGILICGTGIGMSMTANKFPNVRAAVCTDCFSARMSREHNDSNILCLGARVVGDELALEIVRVWIGTRASREERHKRRVGKIG